MYSIKKEKRTHLDTACVCVCLYVCMCTALEDLFRVLHRTLAHGLSSFYVKVRLFCYYPVENSDIVISQQYWPQSSLWVWRHCGLIIYVENCRSTRVLTSASGECQAVHQRPHSQPALSAPLSTHTPSSSSIITVRASIKTYICSAYMWCRVFILCLTDWRWCIVHL